MTIRIWLLSIERDGYALEEYKENIDIDLANK